MNDIVPANLTPAALPSEVQSALDALIPPDQQKAQDVLRKHADQLRLNDRNTHRAFTQIEDDLFIAKNAVRKEITANCYDYTHDYDKEKQAKGKEFLIIRHRKIETAPDDIKKMIDKFMRKKPALSQKTKKALGKKIDNAIGLAFTVDGSQVTWFETGKIQMPATTTEVELDWATHPKTKDLVAASEKAEIAAKQAQLDFDDFMRKMPRSGGIGFSMFFGPFWFY